MSLEQERGERLAALESRLAHMETVLNRMDAKLDAWQQMYVPRTELNEMFRARDEQIRKLEGNNTWLWRTVGGAFLTGVISWLFFFLQK